MCVCWGGRHGIAKEAYLKAGVYLRQGNEKEWTTKLVILQIRPVTSSLFAFRWRVFKEGGVSVLWHGLQNMQQKIKHVDDKVDHRGLGAQKKGCPMFSFSGFLLICANKILD